MKFAYFIFFFLVFFGFSYIFFFSNFSLSLDYFNLFLDSFDIFCIGFFFGLDSIFFFLMVGLVTFFVSIYSEIYMEYYNVNKYFFLMFCFFFSMVILSFSSTPLMLIIGWDGLGITSICLIMFYPNFYTMSNSIYVMFFNRLGDVLLICCSCFFLFSSSFFFWFLDFGNFFFLLFFCACTKSAQFPLSSWLPLAMSAPTPISAMVHSSTLVTAGIFILFKFFDFLFYSIVIDFFKFYSCLTFILGGFMACLELDFKKVVAFSTMSQISMIIFFCTFGFKFLSLFHMFIHAIFKSLLFSCSGLNFFCYFMDQNFSIMTQKVFISTIKFSFFVSVFSMSGLLFSSSFFTKDYIIEWVFSSFSFELVFIFLILGSFFTLSYSSLLLFSLVNFYSSKIIFNVKSFNFIFFFIYGLFSLISGFIFSFFLDFHPFISSFDLFFLNLLFLFFFFFLYNNSGSLFLSFLYFTYFLNYSKWLVSFPVILTNYIYFKEFTLTDLIIFKFEYFFVPYDFKYFFSFFGYYIFFIFGILLVLV